MALPLVASQQQLDEITGNCLTQRFTYFEGDYDSFQREFRGFARLYQLDSETPAADLDSGFTAPALVKTWFHTGRSVDQPLKDCFEADNDAPVLGPTLLTRFHEQDGADQIITPDPETAREMAYALAGHVLRSETHHAESIAMLQPYTVTQQRYLLRQPHAGHKKLIGTGTGNSQPSIRWVYQRPTSPARHLPELESLRPAGAQFRRSLRPTPDRK
nr:hypothetical protein GCM10020185_51630 [Pseudomonas brassicacearum subsp. brassicacearum]